MNTANTKTTSAILATTLGLCLVFFGACAKKKPGDGTTDTSPQTAPTVIADNPNAQITEILQSLRGRWVKEVADPNSPNPPMMRMFLVANNTLQGRLLNAGAYEDAGVAATLKQDGDTFTLVLVDDELREHAGIPRERTFTGTFDAEKKELNLKSKDTGEWITFTLLGGYKLQFSGSLMHCAVIPLPSTPAGTPGTTAGTRPAVPPPVPAPVPLPDPGTAPASTGPRPHHLFFPSDEAIENLMPVDPTPTTPVPSPAATPDIPPARPATCGSASYYQDDWSRMSGIGQ